MERDDRDRLVQKRVFLIAQMKPFNAPSNFFFLFQAPNFFLSFYYGIFLNFFFIFISFRFVGFDGYRKNGLL